MNIAIVYLASQFDSKLSTGDSRYEMLKESIKNTSKYLSKYKYIIFHEDYKEDQFEEIRVIQPNVEFHKLDFVREELDFNHIGRNKGYMLMCRFFSGELQQILIKNGFNSYIRFDDDSFLIPPFHEDIVKNVSMFDYSYRTLFYDAQAKHGSPMQSLYEFTKKYIISKGHDYDNIKENLINYRFIDKNEKYLGLAPYNNFHYANLKIFKDPFIKEYFDNLLEMNGCLLNYWMDANIHSMLIFMLLPFTDYKSNIITNFGYRHNRHFSIINSAGFRYMNNEKFYPNGTS